MNKCNYCGTSPLDTIAGLCVTCGHDPATPAPQTDKGIVATMHSLLDGAMSDARAHERELIITDKTRIGQLNAQLGDLIRTLELVTRERDEARMERDDLILELAKATKGDA